jgi:diguanylate cyclase (GGDEF)-like protein
MFEPRTLVIITAITLLVTSLAIALSWFVNRRIRGAHYWSWGYMLLAGGVALEACQGYLPPILTIALANTLIACGMYYTYHGVSLFQGRGAPAAAMMPLMLLLVVGMHIYAGVGSDGFAKRTLLISGSIALFAFMIGKSFLTDSSSNNRIVYRINAAIYFAMSMAFVVRSIAPLFITPPENLVVDTSFNNFTYLGATLFTILIAFSYMLTLFDKQGIQIQRAVDTDVATGLLNRDAITRQADQLIKRMQALGGGVSAIFFRINRVQGYDDREQEAIPLVYRFAEKLYRSFKPQDLVARIGEREFAVVLEHGEGREHLIFSQQIAQLFNSGPQHSEVCGPMVEYVAVEASPGIHSFDEMVVRAERKWSTPGDDGAAS